MADEGLHQHDISDAAWEKLESLLLGQREICDDQVENNRRFIDAIR
jgi:hypothetical protein